MHVPRLHHYYGLLRPPSLVLLTSLSLASCTTRVFVGSLPSGTETLRPWTWRIRVRLLRCRGNLMEGLGSPRFLDNPNVNMPCSPTAAGGAPHSDTGAPLDAFHSLKSVGSHDDVNFAAQSHGLLTHCLRFNPCPLPRKRQDSLPDGCYPCPGGVRTHWVVVCNFRSSRSFPNIQACPGALRPNPSLKRSANGRPPGPVWRYAVHFRQPGPGVLPSSLRLSEGLGLSADLRPPPTKP